MKNKSLLQRNNNSAEKESVGENLIVPAPSKIFELGFMTHSLEQQIIHCDHYEMLDCFKKWLPNHQPVLEAGCGSGRWIVWFTKQGWEATGIDWSSSLRDRAKNAFPEIHFDTGDMRKMPYLDGQFGSLISLGAIEHSIEGPHQSLNEFHRVLKSDGIAIVTVPYLGLIRKLSRFMSSPVKLLKQSPIVRKIFHKPTGNISFPLAKRAILVGCSADFIMTDEGWEFFQYHFSKKQMRTFIKKTGFTILHEFVEFHDEGVLHNFGRVAGEYNYEKGRVTLTWLGKIIKTIIPRGLTGNMLCYVLMKKDD